MPRRGRLLLAEVLLLALLACQSSAAPPASAVSTAGASTPARPAVASPALAPSSSGSPVPGPAAAKPAGSPVLAAQSPVRAGSLSSPVVVAPRSQGPAPRIGLELLPFRFKQPLFLTHAGDSSGRLFVVEKGGAIRIVKDGQLLPTPFLDISSKIRASGSEQGLLGLAFHPRYVENGRFFVGYTDRQGRDTVERYQVSGDPDQGDPNTGVVLLSLDDPAPNHNGGMVLFGPDGKLWVGTGDGGGAGDQYKNGQNKQTLLGKMLRLDVDAGEPYAIPSDNPYVGNPEFRPEIWAIGLRNPWRYSFDRATGDLWIGDVGQNAYEEIDRIPAGPSGLVGGLNFGWPITEGRHCYPAGSGCDPGPYVPPVAEYGRESGCSVTGGYVYRGPSFPSLHGLYFFGDFCTGRIWSLDSSDAVAWRMTEQVRDALQITSFGEDEAGELYITTFSGTNDGHRIYQIVAR